MADNLMTQRSKSNDASHVRRVQIDVGAQGAWLDAESSLQKEIQGLLIPHLEYEVRQYNKGGPHGYQEHRERCSLHTVRLERQAAFPAGFVPRFARILRDHGYDVEIVDQRDFKKIGFDAKYAKSLIADDRSLADVIRQNPQGQIEAKNFADVIEKTRLIVNLYPKARVLIPVATRKMAWKVQDQFCTEDAGWGVHLLSSGEGWPREPYRCTVCTFTKMWTCHAQDYDIVLLPDLRITASERGVQAMARLHGAWDRKIHRVYGFLQPGLRLGRRDRIRMEAISGQIIRRLGPEKAGVRILWLPAPGCSAIDKDATALEFKRRAYWHNDRRNDYVAAVARAFESIDTNKLRKYGVPFSGGQPALRNAPESIVVVFVASTEQGRELAKRLPGWKLLSAVAGSSNQEVESALSIITESRASKSKIDADVIIRAGGSAGTGCFKDLAPLADATTKRNMIMVDFDDEFDLRAVRDVNWRRREYELLGWGDEDARK